MGIFRTMFNKVMFGWIDHDNGGNDEVVYVPAYDGGNEGPSTTRVVLILAGVAAVVFSIGYTLRPVSTIFREVYDGKCDHENEDTRDSTREEESADMDSHVDEEIMP